MEKLLRLIFASALIIFELTITGIIVLGYYWFYKAYQLDFGDPVEKTTIIIPVVIWMAQFGFFFYYLRIFPQNEAYFERPH